MILLTQLQPLVFQAVHHAVEHIDYAVGLTLVYVGKTAAEILFAKQVHTVGHRPYQSHCRAIEQKQHDETE